MNYVMCDENGEIYDLETTAREYEVLCPFDGPMAHSNHYLTDRLKPFERRQWDQRGQSILRWGRATRLLKSCDKRNADALKNMLSDRVNTPVGICRHNEIHNGEACGQDHCRYRARSPGGEKRGTPRDRPVKTNGLSIV